MRIYPDEKKGDALKAIRIQKTGGPDVLEYVDIETPRTQTGQVVVRTESISVNYADVMVREGQYPVMPPLPTVLGLEGSGVVEDVGQGVSGVRKGQRVSFIAQGSYAEKVAVDSASLIPLPDDIDFDSAAAFPVIYLTAYHLLHTLGHIRDGRWVLLHAAAGGVGTAVIQLARIAGVNVIGLTSSREKAARARELGVEQVFTYDDPNLVRRVLEASDGKGVDLVLDSVAGPNFGRNFEMLAPLGQVIWFGNSGGLPADGLLQSLGQNFVKGFGLRTFHLTYSLAEPYPEMFGRSVGTLITYLREKKIEPVIAARIPLEEAARAHQLLESRKTVGKVILKPGK